jgi:competence protein ComEA
VPEDVRQSEPVSRRLRHVVAPGVDEFPPAHDDAAPAPRHLPGPNPFDPGRRGVRALAVLAAVVVVVAAFLAWRARPRPEPVPQAEVAVPAQAPEPAPERGQTPVAGDEVVVAVAGKVRRPGLVRLPAGSRVADAVQAAGGLLPGADVAFLNLARKVVDGELILVGVTAPPGAAGPMPDPGAVGAGPDAGAGAPVNLNTATLAQLDSLPGVGPILAQRILDHRERHGAFRAVSDLRQVDGIGEARYEQLKELVTV